MPTAQKNKNGSLIYLDKRTVQLFRFRRLDV